jgi:hypothetical protein
MPKQRSKQFVEAGNRNQVHTPGCPNSFPMKVK